MKAGSAQAKAVVFVLNPKKYATDAWHDSTVFDCWADPVAHLLLLKSSMTTDVYLGNALKGMKAKNGKGPSFNYHFM